MDSVRRVTQELIGSHFIELRSTKILFQKVRKVDYFAATARLIPFKTFLIKYHKKLLSANDQVIRGCIAHELCHIEDDLRKNFAWYFLENIIINFNDSYATQLERKIDYAVLNKGLGEELLAFQKFHDRYYEPYTEEDGLTKKEIKRFLAKND